jgi:hypothetical protein
MKNIHIIPTDKPSPLMIEDGKLFFSKNFGFNEFNETKNFRHINKQNIYITSDDEIKEGDWVKNITIPLEKPFKLDKDGILYTQLAPCEFRKIILTDNKDLIKDGVQAIDDKFLEWFVMNPSCEEVEVKKGYKNPNSKSFLSEVYKIYVPTEKSKQDALNHFLSTSSDIVKDPQKWDFNKQETLEEYIERETKSIIEPSLRAAAKSFLNYGAKWQQKQSYSEQEAFNMLMEFWKEERPEFKTNPVCVSNWFEQNKKK